MRVQCPQCGAGGNMPDARIPAQGTNIVCPKCKASFFVQKESLEPIQNAPGEGALEYYQAGIAFLKNKQVDAAIEQLRVAIEMKPDYAEAYRYLGLAYGQKNAWEEASRVLEKAIKSQPDDLLSLKNLGVAYLQQKRFAEAEQILQQALQYAPNDEKVRSYLSMATRGKQQSQPVFSEEAPAMRANEAKKNKKTSTFIDSEAQASPIGQQDPVQALLDKGIDFLENGQHNKALETFQEVIRIAPQSSDGYFGLGMVHENRKEWSKAADAYQKAISCNPNDVLAQENLKFVKKQQKKFNMPFSKK
ncbi:peptidase S1 and S6 chymotrypsin/Hap [Candidatus Vecturithrix granuli]|uniref:Peptidase S1 and S6 chymotrypsin/Hap n=1 Tax=Vecturithrix granuli TaxID=1499967 RepID=A0A081BZU4_VECG1|nr:peptidase S1 and S6 chymotrypsin/Hap [Candidatus Vecturithrix granuli]